MRNTPRNGEPAALAADVIALMDALKIDQATLAGYDWGARTADIVAALWPQRVKGLVSVSGYLIGSQEAGKQPLPPEAELQWWYQFYFATERGRIGYEKNHRDFAKLIWKLASPQWSFDDATCAQRGVAGQSGPRCGHGVQLPLAPRPGKSEAKYESLEARWPIPEYQRADHHDGRRCQWRAAPEPAAYAKRFTGKYRHQLIAGGVGHNLPQEAPEAFAQAVIDVGQL
jgi:pimeloyl-ACP methyl ester carboxylesterase